MSECVEHMSVTEKSTSTSHSRLLEAHLDPFIVIMSASAPIATPVVIGSSGGGGVASPSVSSLFSYVSSVGSRYSSAIARTLTASVSSANAGLTPITARLFVMAFPSADEFAAHMRELSTAYSAQSVMIWNLAEKPLPPAPSTATADAPNVSIIDERFPGFPAPPMARLLSIAHSVYSFLSADAHNISVVSCQTGRGRSLVVTAATLLLSGAVDDVDAAQSVISARIGRPLTDMLIPTQRRYISYLHALAVGVAPSASPIYCERIILNGIPRMERTRDSTRLCRPYCQIFSDGKLIYASTGRDTDNNTLRWYGADDRSVLFAVNQWTSRDLLVRIRHLASNGARVSVCRFALHCAFVSPTDGDASGSGNVRLYQRDLDGVGGSDDSTAVTADTLADSFFVDCVFRQFDTAFAAAEPVNADELAAAANTAETITRLWEARRHLSKAEQRAAVQVHNETANHKPQTPLTATATATTAAALTATGDALSSALTAFSSRVTPFASAAANSAFTLFADETESASPPSPQQTQSSPPPPPSKPSSLVSSSAAQSIGARDASDLIALEQFVDDLSPAPTSGGHSAAASTDDVLGDLEAELAATIQDD